MIKRNNVHEELTEWAFEIFREKAIFDLKRKYCIQTATMVDDYIEDCSYAITVILRKSGMVRVQNAQEALTRNYNHYYRSVLGHQCMTTGKLTTRNRKALPLTFLAFDIEGTCHNQFDVVTTDPHGHGAIMFDEETLFNFRKMNAKFRREDGSYEITDPTPGIALIKLSPFCSIAGFYKFIRYSLKYAAKLKESGINVSPYEFYPPTSVNYPFWKHLASTALDTYEVRWIGNDKHNVLERLWNLDHSNRRNSRGIRRRRGATAAWRPTI